MERLTDSFFQIINSLIESFWGKLDLPWLLTLDFVCFLFYSQYRLVQTDAPATGAANIGSMPFRESRNTNNGKYECPQRLRFSPGNLFWGSFTKHNTGNYLRHGINITINQRLSLTFRGNGNTIIVGDSQTSPLPIFPEGGGTSVHRLTRRAIVLFVLSTRTAKERFLLKGTVSEMEIKKESPFLSCIELTVHQGNP